MTQAAARAAPTRSGTPTRSSTRSSDWAKLRRHVRHRGRRHRQAHRLRHHRPDQQGAAGRPAGQLARRAARRQPRGLHPRRRRHPDHDRRDQARHLRDPAEHPRRRRSVDGKTYGVPIGANTLALYYNKKVLSAAGVDPATVKDWASLTAALDKVKAAGKKGITFSAIGTEEGSFQFLPWFWGSGANLTKLDSTPGRRGADAVDGLGRRRATRPTRSSTTRRPPAGRSSPPATTPSARTAPGSSANAKKAGFAYGVITDPGQNGGDAAAPTGGEFVTVPVQKDTARYATATKIVDLPDQHGQLADHRHHAVLHRARPRRVQAQQVAAEPGAEAVGRRGRTRPRAAPATTSAPSTRRSRSSCGRRCRPP